MKRKWLLILGAVPFALSIILFQTSVENVNGLKETAAKAIQLLLDNDSRSQERLESIGGLLLQLAGLLIWFFSFLFSISTTSKFLEDKVSGYKRFLVGIRPALKIGKGIFLCATNLICYGIVLLMNSTILLLVSALLVIGLNGLVPTNVHLFELMMQGLYRFFSLQYIPSSFVVDVQSLKPSEIFGNQSIAFFVILFVYLIKGITSLVFKFTFGKIGDRRVTESFLKLNEIFNCNYLRILIYSVAVQAFLIQAFYKIMSDVNNIFAVFIIVDVIFYTLVSWMKGRASRANEKLKDYLNEVYHYMSEIERLFGSGWGPVANRGGIRSVSFKAGGFHWGIVDKICVCANKEWRQRYSITMEITGLLKRKHSNTDEMVRAAADIKKRILNARPNPTYAKSAKRLVTGRLKDSN